MIKELSEKFKFETLIFLLTIAILTFTTLYSIPAADNWWNLATGRYIIENLRIPRWDIFSYTAQGSPWIVTQWLFQVFLYALYFLSGLKGIYLLRTFLLLSTLSVVYYHCITRKLNPLLSSAVLIISVFIAQPYYYFDIRAYLVSYLFTALYYFLLERRKIEKKSFPLWLLPLINCIWVNCHSAFFTGFFLIFIYFTDEYFREEEGKKSSIFLIKAGLLTFLSSFINPWTYKILIYPFRLGMGRGFWQQFLNEWNPPELFGRNLSFTIFFSLCILITVLTIKKATIRDILIFIALGYLSFKAVRHITLFCIVIIPVMAKHLDLLMPAKFKTDFTDNLRKALEKNIFLKIITLLICLSIFLRTTLIIFTTDFSMEKEMFPYYGSQFVRENNLPGRMYNPYEWGGYIIWKLYPEKTVFCDGRAETVYSVEICKDSYFSMKGEDISVLDKYNINTVLCNKINEPQGMLLPVELQKLPELWVLIYSDENSYIFIRNTPSNKDIIEKFYLGDLKVPDSPFACYYQACLLLEKGKPEKALDFLKKALEKNEFFPEAWMTKGYIMAITGKQAEGERCFLKVLELSPSYPGAHYNLGLIYKSAGLREKALEEFKKELDIHPYTPAEEEVKLLEKNDES